MSTSRITSKCIAGGLLLALAGTAGVARADCAADGTVAAGGSGVCYKLKGSDTLFDIMTQAITSARASSDTALAGAARDLFYEGTGSGNAETALRTATATGVGVQSIGPMSRNFRPSIIDASSPDYSARTAGGTQSGHAAWAPTTANVVGLDAAVFVVKGTSALADIDFPTFNDTAVPTAFRKATQNNAGLPTNFGNGGAFNNLSAAANYSNLMSVVLSGVDGSGTLTACSDPRRVQAVQDIASLVGASTLAHVLRRDDNSGTTDTFKDRIMVVPNSGAIATRYPWTGGRFCNGTAIGLITGAASQQGICSNARTTYCTSNANCTGGGVCQFNLNNQDFDPIRRPCMAASATAAPTSCTDMTTGLPCQAGDGNANCTQGLVVALSDTDPGSSDITTSIGRRIGNASGEIIGYAGREAGSATFGTKTLNINTIQSVDDRVRDSTYLLARRLFIQNSAVNSALGSPDYPTLNQTANGNTGGGADQLAKEQLLWNGMLSNRTLMDPIVRQFNFIRCGTFDGEDPGTLSNNLCSIVPAAPVPGAYGAYLPSGAVSGNNGGAKGIAYDGRVPTTVTAGSKTTGWQNGRACTVASSCSCSTTTPCLDLPLVAVTSASAALCVTGGSAPAGGACPAPALRPSNAPCTVNAECSSNVCADRFAHSTGGVDGLYCN